jgi:hypothetical protein
MYLIEPLAGENALTMLISRFVKFLQNIKKSPKLAAQFLLQKVLENVNTVTGRNVRMIKDIIGHDYDILLIIPAWLWNKVKFCEISEQEKCRVNFIEEITNINQMVLNLPATADEDSFLTSEQLNEIIEHLCIS